MEGCSWKRALYLGVCRSLSYLLGPTCKFYRRLLGLWDLFSRVRHSCKKKSFFFSFITFVLKDKTSSLLFALTILVFVYMWAKAIAIMSEATSIVVHILTACAVIIAVAITIVTVFYAVSISRTFVSAFYGIFVVDFAEIIVASFTFALIICLFIFILVVGSHLRRFAGEDTSDRSDVQKGTVYFFFFFFFFFFFLK